MAVTAEAIPALTHEEAEATARIADELRREAAQLPTSSTARAWMLRCAGLLDLALERPRRPLGLPR